MISGLQDINFNNSQFNFEQEDTEAVFSRAVLLTKSERRHRMTKCIFIFFLISRKHVKLGK